MMWKEGGNAAAPKVEPETPWVQPPLVEAIPNKPSPKPKPAPISIIDFEGETIEVEKKGPTPDEIREEIQKIEKDIRKLAPELKKALEDGKSETIGAIPFFGWLGAAVYDVIRGDPSSAAQNVSEEGAMHFGEKAGEKVLGTTFGEVPIIGSAIDTYKMGKALEAAGQLQEKMEALRLRRYRLKDQLGDADARYDDPNDRKGYLGPGGRRYDKRTGKPFADIQGRFH